MRSHEQVVWTLSRAVAAAQTPGPVSYERQIVCRPRRSLDQPGGHNVDCDDQGSKSRVGLSRSNASEPLSASLCWA